MQTNIEKNVMRRVHTIHALRPIFSFATASCLLLLLAVWGIGQEVWVARVFQNMPQGDVMALSRFFLAAFDNTRLIVQALSLLAFLSLMYLAREMGRIISGLVPVRT